MSREKDPLAVKRIVDDVRVERRRQDEKWGAKSIATRPIERGLTVLTEEVGEVAQALLMTTEIVAGDDTAAAVDRATVRAEIVQVAAVAVAMLEALDGGAPLLLEESPVGVATYLLTHEYKTVGADEAAPSRLFVSENGVEWYDAARWVREGRDFARAKYARVVTPLAGAPR